MKAVVIDRYGGNEVVRAGEMPDPELRDEDVLVQIHAASVNPLDLKIREGKLKLILPSHRMLAAIKLRTYSCLPHTSTADD